MKIAFLLMISTLFHHGFNTKITILEKKEIFVSEDDEPNYEIENNKVQSWEDVLIGYDTDKCDHPNNCDPLPCCAQKRIEVACCPSKDGVCCDDFHCCGNKGDKCCFDEMGKMTGCCPANSGSCCPNAGINLCCSTDTPVCCGSIAPGYCCPLNTVCHPDGCYGIDGRVYAKIGGIPQTGSSKTITVAKRTFPWF